MASESEEPIVGTKFLIGAKVSAQGSGEVEPKCCWSYPGGFAGRPSTTKVAGSTSY